MEHVTNPHLGGKRAGTWRAFTEGGSMVFQGLRTHFPADRVAMISYQIPMPKAVATMNEVSMAAGERAGGRSVFIVDGEPKMTGALEYYRADRGFDVGRNAVLERLAVPSAHEIELEAKVETGIVTGRVRIKGPDQDGCTVQVLLAEKGVLYPGMGATVVHRMVARGALTESASGVPFVAAGDGMVLDFSRSVDDIVSSNRAFLEQYEAEHQVDATRLSVDIAKDQLLVIAILRVKATNRVLQSAQLDLSRRSTDR